MVMAIKFRSIMGAQINAVMPSHYPLNIDRTEHHHPHTFICSGTTSLIDDQCCYNSPFYGVLMTGLEKTQWSPLQAHSRRRRISIITRLIKHCPWPKNENMDME